MVATYEGQRRFMVAVPSTLDEKVAAHIVFKKWDSVESYGTAGLVLIVNKCREHSIHIVFIAQRQKIGKNKTTKL